MDAPLSREVIGQAGLDSAERRGRGCVRPVRLVASTMVVKQVHRGGRAPLLLEPGARRHYLRAVRQPALPVPTFLLDELRQEIDGRGPDDLVFSSPQGTALRVQNFRPVHFDRAAEEAGVGGLVPHELRHTAASLAISAGATVRACSGCSGTRRRR